MEQPKTSELAKAAAISLSYASEIVGGKRKPSRSLAIHILRATNWRHPSIADLTDDDIAMLERVEPFRPTPDTAQGRAA